MIAIDLARQHIEQQHAGASGFITLARKDRGDSLRQYHYQAGEMAARLPEWLGEDTYISQNTFYRPARRIEFLRQLRSLYVDVDFYLYNYTPEWVIGKIQVELINEGRIPDPNIIIHSGRGIVPIWFIEPVPAAGLSLWQAVENHFFQQFKNIGGDPKATDAARIFRLAGSVNSKSGEMVQVEYRHDYRYTLRELQRDYLPELTPASPDKQEKRRAKRQGSHSMVRMFNLHTLNYYRLIDLVKLVELRGGHMTGMRETACFYYRYWNCLFTSDPDEALRQTLEFNGSFSHPLPIREVERATRSAEKAAAAKGEKKADAIARQLGYPAAGYNISNEKLIEQFAITSDEQTHMKTIITRGEKNRRKKIANEQKRRSDGVPERAQYLANQADKTAEQLHRLREALAANPKAKQRDLAELLGLSVRHIKRLKARLEE